MNFYFTLSLSCFSRRAFPWLYGLPGSHTHAKITPPVIISNDVTKNTYGPLICGGRRDGYSAAIAAVMSLVAPKMAPACEKNSVHTVSIKKTKRQYNTNGKAGDEITNVYMEALGEVVED
jgi:hypothetical protein